MSQDFQILSHSGSAHFTIHSEATTSLAEGRLSGLKESIDLSIEKKGIPLSWLE